jgi:hypothetical protein
MMPAGWRRSACVVVIGLMVSSGAVRGQDALRVTCLPDKAVALPDETVGLATWLASAAGPVTGNITASWTASGGRIDGQGLAARWSLAGAPVDRRQTATVSVQIGGTSAGSCELGVWVADPTADAATGVRVRGEFITRRAFLRSGQAGEPGFGLYSYFLMREPANEPDKSRASSFVAAFLDVLVGVADQEIYVERRRLNGSYMPVTMDPPRGLSGSQRTAWALDHYDYERSKAFLSLYPTLTGPGPFIVAVPAPLRSAVKPMLPWDFSQVDTVAIPDGVSRFLNQAAQLYDWQDQGALPKLREQLLTAVAGMFVGRASAESWMQIVR